MIIKCTYCNTPHGFKENSIRLGLSRVRCGQCRQEFKLFDPDAGIASPLNPDAADFLNSDFIDLKLLVKNSGLSVRAANVLGGKMGSMGEFLKLDEEQLWNIRSCGKKTVTELLEFQRKLNDGLGLTVNKKRPRKRFAPPSMPLVLKENTNIFDSIKQQLSSRARNILSKHKIDSLQKFVNLKGESLYGMKNCGIKTINEIIEHQDKIYCLIFKIKHRKRRPRAGSAAWKEWSRYVEAMAYELFEFGEQVNPEEPFPSLEKWVSEISGASEKRRIIFMLKMGMLGNRPMIYENIGRQFRISKQRVTQLIKDVERASRHSISGQRLKPLIERALELVHSRGGIMSRASLLSLLLNRGPDGDMLRFASPFIDFMSELPAWGESGLIIHDDAIHVNNYQERVSEIASEIVSISRRCADEVIDENLWSIDYAALKEQINAWHSQTHPDENIVIFSNTIIEQALMSRGSEVTKGEGRVFSTLLWSLRYDSIPRVVETVMRASDRAMHLSEVHARIKEFRPNHGTLSSKNVHAAMSNNDNLLIWNRGTFLHKNHIQIPYDLIDEIQKWILKKLGRKVPFISSHGPFKAFETACLDAGIPNEGALYSVLREASHARIAYPKIPYIYFKRRGVSKIPIGEAFEKYIKDSGGVVSYKELKNYALEKLYLKKFQFGSIKSHIPNTIRTREKGFIHTDNL